MAKRDGGVIKMRIEKMMGIEKMIKMKVMEMFKNMIKVWRKLLKKNLIN